MALRVCDIDIAETIPGFRLQEKEDGIFCLIRHQGIPVGDITILAPSGYVTSALIKEKIANELVWDIFNSRLIRYISNDDPDKLPHRITDTDGSLPLVSLIVCTRDRANDLRNCLESLKAVKYPNMEIIVVDNASKENSTKLAAMDAHVRYIREEKGGLDFARNAGIRAAKGAFVAFADDDVAVDPNWVYGFLAGFEDEAVVCVTGLTMPAELAAEAQLLFEQYSTGGFRKGYKKRVFDRFNTIPAAAGGIGAGANMAFRREIFDVLGCFDEALDCGTPALAGGDLDMFYRILRAGYKICYQPRAVVWHRHRRTIGELERQMLGYGTAVYAFLTKCVLEYRDPQAIHVGFIWMRSLAKQVYRSMTGSNKLPFNLSVREFIGAFRGPLGYARGKTYVSRIRQAEGSERRLAARRKKEGIAKSGIMLLRRLRGGVENWM